MKKVLALSLLAVVFIAACGKADKQQTEATSQQQEETKQVMEKKADDGKLEKWPADYPVDANNVAVISVEQEGVGELGEIVLEFYPDKAPDHVRNFTWLANHKFYDGTKFHRVIKDFMIQGGDPLSKDDNPGNDGTGGPGWQVNAEFNDLKHVKGILSMARGPAPNSAGSQFFICHAAYPSLDGKYSIFGNTIKGLDVVDKIANVEVAGRQGSTPVKPVIIKSVRIVPRSEIQL